MESVLPWTANSLLTGFPVHPRAPPARSPHSWPMICYCAQPCHYFAETPWVVSVRLNPEFLQWP